MDLVWRTIVHVLSRLLRLAVAIAVIVFAFTVLYLTEVTVETVFADRHYFQDHGWPRLLGMLAAATPLFFLARYLDSRSSQLVAGQQAGQQLVVGPSIMQASSSALKVWPVILAIIGIIMIFV